jgi:ubiquinone/menaquinone biosynthesis C-methylase UbiE
MNHVRAHIDAEQTTKSHDVPSGANSKREFFDAIAAQWDGFQGDLKALREMLARGLSEMGIRESETVLDVGCGTGNLTHALLQHLSTDGRVVAVDISPRMLTEARRKLNDPRVEWIEADATYLSLPDGYFDRIICFCVWPHFDDRVAAAGAFSRLLRTGGSLHIWHPISRAQVNDIHTTAGEAVRADLLAPAIETAKLFEENGFTITELIDDESRYLISMIKSIG